MWRVWKRNGVGDGARGALVAVAGKALFRKEPEESIGTCTATCERMPHRIYRKGVGRATSSMGRGTWSTAGGPRLKQSKVWGKLDWPVKTLGRNTFGKNAILGWSEHNIY